MGLKATVEFKGFIPAMKQKEINDTLRGSYRDLGGEFFDKNLPRRFTYAGGKTLNYKPRSWRHNSRKKKLFGHVDPLVFSGATRARALSAETTRIIAKAKKGVGVAELVINAPTLNFRRGNGPDMRDEITRIATREVPPLERFLEKVTTKRFDEYQATATKTL